MSEGAGFAAIGALAARRGELSLTLDTLAGEGRDLALQAALGDRAAARRSARHQARETALSVQLAAIDHALADAAGTDGARDAAAAAARRAQQERAIASLLRKRLDATAKIEAGLRQLIVEIAALDAAGVALAEAGRDFDRVAFLSPLGREATGGRLAEFMAGIGYDSWLPLARPEIRPAIADLAAAERAAQQAWRRTCDETSGEVTS